MRVLTDERRDDFNDLCGRRGSETSVHALEQTAITNEGGYRTYYCSQGGTVIAEYSETPALPTTPKWSKSYLYLGGRLLSTLTPNGSGGAAINYHHPDRLGTRLVTDPSNGTPFEQVSLPYGTALNAESTGATNQRFTSYDRSATTKLDYAVNRHYDPQQGRFTQTDPIGMGAASIGDPQSLNSYSYTQNDPVNFVDPSGLMPNECVDAQGNPVKCDEIIRTYTWDRRPSLGEYIWVLNSRFGGFTGGGGGGGGTTPQNSVQRQEISDCVKFSNMVREIANDTLGRSDVHTFMSRIATTFTEFPGATISDIINSSNYGQGSPQANVFGSEGFAPPYYEQDFVYPDGRHERMNEVRHAAAGLVVGYAFAPFPQTARDRMNRNENPNDPIHGVPDLNLNAQTLPMGERIGGARR